MVVLFIVIGSQVLQCFGYRYCDYMSATEFTRMWEIGLVEIMFEGILSGVKLKVYRRNKDKTAGLRQDRQDKKISDKELGK